MAATSQLVTFALMGLGLLSVLILIAGTGAVHAELDKDDPFDDDLSGAFGLVGSGPSPNDVLGFSWWVAIYSLGLYVAVGISEAMGTQQQRFRQLLVHMLAAAFAMSTVLCHQAVTFARQNDSEGLDSRSEVWAAGAIMCTLVTFALLLWLGSEDSRTPNVGVLTPHNQEMKTTPPGAGAMPGVNTGGPVPAVV